MNETDLLTAILDEQTNLCLSGGAAGSDLQWGMCAGLLGHKVIHWSFDGHRTQAPEQEVVRLSAEQLAKADEAVAKAAKSLKRAVPNKPWVKPLIQRNWYQVAWSNSIYAVCDYDTETDQLKGGTAWAIQMYLDRDIPHNCHIFAQNVNTWMSWDDRFDGWFIHVRDYDDAKSLHVAVPQPSGIWAGVGTRDLNQNGKDAIRRLMEYQKPTL